MKKSRTRRFSQESLEHRILLTASSLDGGPRLDSGWESFGRFGERSFAESHVAFVVDTAVDESDGDYSPGDFVVTRGSGTGEHQSWAWMSYSSIPR